MKTYMAKAETCEPSWYLVDAADKTLGRLASELAKHLRGKYQATFTPHVNMGNYFVVINADKVRVTGNKLAKKIYHHHTGHIGGIKSEPLEKLLNRKPTEVLELAVKGMLPKGPLGRELFTHLKVYAGKDHPHAAQQPVKIETGE
ncbi:MAG: 50S ribosomal protein L13 [Gammaproteobacteria bacterium]|nr:50S ribosomal protein L13 [Gammaproteobacteria bacterium]